MQGLGPGPLSLAHLSACLSLAGLFSWHPLLMTIAVSLAASVAGRGAVLPSCHGHLPPAKEGPLVVESARRGAFSPAVCRGRWDTEPLAMLNRRRRSSDEVEATSATPLYSVSQFSFLMTEALLIFSPETSLLRSFSRKVKVRVHWALQLLALLCALLGLGIITYNKHLNGKAHFVTWHGLMGLLTVLYAGGQCGGGVLLLYPKLMKNWTLAKLKLYHATSGLVGYLLGCASLMLGMCSLWFTTSVTSISWYLAMLCPLITSLVIMNQVSNAYLYRKRSQH